MSTQTRDTEKSIVKRADSKAIKRAQWEAFEFTMEAPGMVRVSNESYEDGAAHSYLVNIEVEVPCACECEAFQYGEGPCKHMIAVAIREPVLLAAQRELITDGGENPDTCQNGQTGCCGPEGDDLPCFECFQSQKR